MFKHSDNMELSYFLKGKILIVKERMLIFLGNPNRQYLPQAIEMQKNFISVKVYLDDLILLVDLLIRLLIILSRELRNAGLQGPDSQKLTH